MLEASAFSVSPAGRQGQAAGLSEWTVLGDFFDFFYLFAGFLTK
jgi:hypothetical protein